jgi:hypothetical protein
VDDLLPRSVTGQDGDVLGHYAEAPSRTGSRSL